MDASDSEIQTLKSRIRELETDAKLGAIEKRLDEKVEKLSKSVQDFETILDRRATAMETAVDKSVAAMEAKVDTALQVNKTQVTERLAITGIGITIVIAFAAWFVTSSINQAKDIAKYEAQNTTMQILLKERPAPGATQQPKPGTH